MRCPANFKKGVSRLGLLAQAEALARKVDEFKPGYYSTLLKAYDIRRLEKLSACELYGLIDVLNEDLLALTGADVPTTHYDAMKEVMEYE